MTKKLNTESIANELEGASLFFTKSPTSPPADSTQVPTEISQAVETPTPAKPLVETAELEVSKKLQPRKTERPSNHDTVIPRHHDTTTPRYHDTTIPEVHGVAIEIVRKAVKEFGKEAATHRFTDK